MTEEAMKKITAKFELQFERRFNAGRILGAIQTYESLFRKVDELPPKSFLKVSELKKGYLAALGILHVEYQRHLAENRLLKEQHPENAALYTLQDVCGVPPKDEGPP